jgi:hypothetical protein
MDQLSLKETQILLDANPIDVVKGLTLNTYELLSPHPHICVIRHHAQCNKQTRFTHPQIYELSD